MERRRPATLLPLIGLMLFWPDVLTRSVSSKLQTAVSSRPPAERGGERPHVAKLVAQNCDGTMEHFCLNDGQCMLLVDINEHHCRCQVGFSGPRCSHLELVYQPMADEQIIATILCVILLIAGLTGTLCFCCKWYKKGRFRHEQRRQGYRGVQTA